MSRRLDDLASEFQPVAFELMARLNEVIGPLMIVDTIRTMREQEINLATGASMTLNSLHLPRVLKNGKLVLDANGKAFALDLCPWEIWQANGPDKLAWPTSDPRWRKIGLMAKHLKLRWGGDWYRPADPKYLDAFNDLWRDPKTVSPYDPGHCEMVVS